MSLTEIEGELVMGAFDGLSGAERQSAMKAIAGARECQRTRPNLSAPGPRRPFSAARIGTTPSIDIVHCGIVYALQRTTSRISTSPAFCFPFAEKPGDFAGSLQ
jgi:hypothetical protein